MGVRVPRPKIKKAARPDFSPRTNSGRQSMLIPKPNSRVDKPLALPRHNESQFQTIIPKRRGKQRI